MIQRRLDKYPAMNAKKDDALRLCGQANHNNAVDNHCLQQVGKLFIISIDVIFL